MKRRTEFNLIETLFAPLTRGIPEALGLKDDAALLSSSPGHELVMTTDALVAGIHFHANDPAELIGRKLLRVSVSDLASMGAEPYVYLLTVVVPAECEETWLEQFAAGLAQDQDTFGIHLAGGDTVSTNGPLVLSLTAIGKVPAGKALRRSGASEGEDIWVSGTIGDAALGLMGMHGDLVALGENDRAALEGSYLLPQPRVGLGVALREIGRSCIDVSDGLAADLGHVCRASGVRGEVQFDHIPLSEPARAAMKVDPRLAEAILNGGDDYELLFTASPTSRDTVLRAARNCAVNVARIGQMRNGSGVVIRDVKGAEIDVTTAGYTHF